MVIHIERKKKNFSQIANAMLEDSSLSFKAKGVLCYLLSKKENWVIRPKDIYEHGKNGMRSIYSSLRELRQCGYARLVVDYDKATHRLTGRHWVVFEERTGVAQSQLKRAPHKTCGAQTVELSNTKNTNNTNTRQASPDLGRDISLNITPPKTTNERAAFLTKKFSQLTIEHRLHGGKKGGTKYGWSAKTLKQWWKRANLLFEVFTLQEIKEVFRWYSFHLKDKFVPQCHTLPSFCDKFTQLQEAMRRQQEKGQPPRTDEFYGERVTKEFLREKGLDGPDTVEDQDE